MKKTLARLSLLSMMCLGSALAGPISVTSGSIGGFITFDGSFNITGFSLNGTAILSVDNTGTASVNIVTDLGAVAPNVIMTAANSGISEFVTLGFDPFSIALAPDLSSFSISALGVPTTAITDPGLAGLSGTTNWVFGFLSADSNTNTYTYTLAGGTANDTLVPEPASFGLLGLALVGGGLYRRYSQRQ